jgi:hypothetical protein
MTHESLANPGWVATVDRLGGAELLEREARDTGAFERAREVKCAVDLLRLACAYFLGATGLRLTAAWAEAVGLASLSNVALMKRLRKTVPWLESMVGRLLASGRGAETVAKGRRIRLVDGTMIAKGGIAGREQGGVWRVHAVFDLPTERFSAFELTDEKEGERIDRAAVVAGEIRVGDRAYLHPDRLAAVMKAGADIVVRAPWSGARWCDADGTLVDLVRLLKRAGKKQVIDRTIHMMGSGGTPIRVRLVALRKPKAATDETIAKLHREAARKGKSLHPSTLVAAGWTILVTSLAADEFSAQKVGELYRLRWRIEIAFKHLKSGAGLGRPPGEDPDLAKAHILCHLLAVLLTEPLLAEHLGASPRRAAA